MAPDSLLRSWLCISLLSAPCAAQSVDFEPRNADDWVRRIEADAKAAVERLAAGQPHSFELLAVLLARDGDLVPFHAAQACERIGPAALPLQDRLLHGLRAAKSWWTQMGCANALAAIGSPTPAVLGALMQHVCKSPIPRLRVECARAALRLDADFVDRALTAVDRGDFVDQQHAIEVLSWLGEPVIDRLLPCLDRKSAAGEVARQSIVRIGWRAVTRLERAGHALLAQQALRLGPLQHVSSIDEYELLDSPPQPPVAQLPTIRWEDGHGHANSLSLFRAHEVDGDLRVEEVTVTETHAAPGTRFAVRARTWTVARARALEATRQLLAIASLRLRKRPGLDEQAGWGSDDFLARVHVEMAGEVRLDASFCDYPTSDNVPRRFQAEAAVGVLYQAMVGASSTDREVSIADRDVVVARRRLQDKDPWWVVQRVQGMADVLQVR